MEVRERGRRQRVKVERQKGENERRMGCPLKFSVLTSETYQPSSVEPLASHLPIGYDEGKV